MKSLADKTLAGICPACGSQPSFLTDWQFSGLNDSIFNNTFDLVECPACGLVYNNSVTDSTLAKFYNKECSYFEKQHFNPSAPANIKKYEYYSGVLRKNGLFDSRIADIGCGRGGYLLWLKKNGWKQDCTGVDIDLNSLPQLKKEGVAFEKGHAMSLPFDDNSQELLTYFHILEHIVDIGLVLQEAGRTLKPSAYIVIEVPDAGKYHEQPVGKAFWISIREHVHHFSVNALCHALYRNGFNVTGVERQMVPTPEFYYPSLMVIAQKRAPERITHNEDKPVAGFVLLSKQELGRQAQEVSDFISGFSQATFWGCSSELFSLLPLLNLQDFRLCDSSPAKQACTYKGVSIESPFNMPVNGALVVAPYLYRNEIQKAAREIGWPENRIYCLS